MYQKILIPLDGSEHSEAALALAADLARRTRAQVHLVTAIEAEMSYAFEGWETSVADWSQAYHEDVIARLKEGGVSPVTARVVYGGAAEAIEREADEVQADVVVMATHGRGALSRAWLGSVADSFVRRTDLPVILVHPEGEGTDDVAALDTIVVPLDGSELSEAALDRALELAELFGSGFHLTRVVPFPLELASPYLPHTATLNQQMLDDAKSEAADYLEKRAETLRIRGLRATTAVVVDQQPARGILSELAAVDGDAVAMSTHGHRGFRRMVLGSTADKVVRGCHKPVLLLRGRDAK